MELYPKQKTDQSTKDVRLGFAVHDLDSVLSAVTVAGALLVSAAKMTPWGRRAVIADSEGHRIELTEVE